MSHSHPPHGYMPFPYPPPWMHPPQQVVQSADEPPARVRMAVRYLAFLAEKGMERAAINDVGIERLEGQRLAPNEVDAQSAAAACLKHYFRGELKPDHWEGLYLLEEQCNRPAPGVPGTLLRCVMCCGEPKSATCLCNGNGTIIVYPGPRKEECTDAPPPEPGSIVEGA